jgi:hypothetical protein
MVTHAYDKTNPGPKITTWLLVDISQHVDEHGQISDGAALEAYAQLAGRAAGAHVFLMVGKLKFPTGRLVYSLAEAGILNAAAINIVGSDPMGSNALMSQIAAIMDDAVTEAA